MATFPQIETKTCSPFLELFSFAVILLAVSLVFLLPVAGHYFAPADDGYYLHVAERLLHGEVLNRDVQSRHAGYIHGINALSLALWGDDLLATRIPLLLAIYLSTGLTYLLLRGKGALTVATGTLVAAIFNAFMAPTPNAHWYCIPLVIGLMVWLRARRGGISLLLPGIIAGLLIGFRQLTGAIMLPAIVMIEVMRLSCSGDGSKPAGLYSRIVAVAASAFVCLLIARQYVTSFDFMLISLWPLLLLVSQCFSARTSVSALLQSAGVISLGICVGLLPLLLYHLWFGSWAALFDDTVIRAGAMTGLSYLSESSFSIYLAAGISYLRAASTVHEAQNAAFWILMTLLPALVGCRALWRLRREGTLDPALVIALFYALVAETYRIHLFLYYTAPILMLALLATERGRAGRALAVTGCVWLSLIAATSHLGQGIHREIWTGQSAVFAASPFPRVGTLIDQVFVPRYQKLTGQVEEHLRGGGDLLALPYSPELYVLTGRRNIFRFVCGADGIQRASDVAGVQRQIADLERLLFVYKKDDKYNTPIQRELADWIILRSRLVAEIDGYSFYLSERA